MLRLFLILCFLTIEMTYGVAQLSAEIEPGATLKKYRDSKSESEKLPLLLKLSSYYVLKLGEVKSNLDSALVLAQQAGELSDRLHNEERKEEVIFLTGMVYIKSHANSNIIQLLKKSSTKTQIRLMLETVKYNVVFVGLGQNEMDSALLFANRSLVLSESINSPELTSQSFLQLSNLYYEKEEIPVAKDFFLKALNEVKKANYLEGEAEIFSQASGNLILDQSLLDELLLSRERLMIGYQKIADKETSSKIQSLIVMGDSQISYYYTIRGNLSKALFYGLEMVKMVEKNNNPFLNEIPYQFVAKIYLDLEKFEQSIEYFKKTCSILYKKNGMVDGTILKNMTKAYIGLDKPAEALAFINTNVKRGGYDDKLSLKLIAESLGNCYFQMKQYDKAEKYYLECFGLAKKMHYRETLVSFVPLGRLYVVSKQYQKAKPYLQELVSDANKAIVPISVQRDAHFMLFKVDSASGKFLSAINHFHEYKSMNDSLFNEKSNGQIEALSLQYETEKKDKDIQLLTTQGELQENALKRARFSRNAFITGAIILFILLATLYSRYQLKQRSNRQLQTQQAEINQQNQLLKQYLAEQEKLVEEKEWLVKEIHHRVKNNLQMVISLLNTQSEFLDHPSALQAIRESRERMQAIALIHQKLYQPDNNSLIDMAAYIQEMVTYLGSSFLESGRINFQLDIECIQLDVSKAVPLGLILNEAITNAVKYAFPNEMQGTITISLKSINDQTILLKVADNGKGLPDDFTIANNGSLGIQLMKLFAEQLEGELSFLTKQGLEISLTFHNVHSEKATRLFTDIDQTNGKNSHS
jgi:two-component system, sensor histidine kinase PdtaS